MTDKINRLRTMYGIADAVAGAQHVPELIPGKTAVGHILTEEQMKLQYSKFAPSSALRWSYCPGSLTKKGNPT